MTLGEELKGHQSKLESASRCLRLRIENDPISYTSAFQKMIFLSVATKIKRFRRHAILGSQLRGEKTASGDRVKTHAIGILR